MKSTCVICVLLGITIGSLVLAEDIAGVKNETQTSASPLPNSTVKVQQNEITTPVSSINITSTSTSDTTSSPTITTPKPTTPTPTKPTSTTSKSTTTTPSTTTNATISSTTTLPSTSAVKTTAEPPAITTSSPSEHRHFDGLSFFGGIILATCLMAIATFSWKFYRQCNERNYRTL